MLAVPPRSLIPSFKDGSAIRGFQDVAEGIAERFKDNPEKITQWWFSHNPLFGHTPPAFLMLMRPEKAVATIKAMLDGEGP